MAINIQRCNAKVILKKLEKLTCSLAEDTLFDGDDSFTFRDVIVFIDDLQNKTICLSVCVSVQYIYFETLYLPYNIYDCSLKESN